MNTRMLQTAALCVALGFASQARAAEPAPPKDGWASWQVDAVEGAPAWCCWGNWNTGANVPASCKLDGGTNGFGSRDHATTDSMRVYAHLVAGKVDQVRALAANCPVEAKTPIKDLGAVAADDSARWLLGHAGGDSDDLLAAVASHRGSVAFDSLATMARTDARIEMRKNAVFWLAVLRGTAGAEVTSSLMFADPNADLRQHAAFALTESKSPRIAADLIKLGNTDKDGDVRSQAWFWLSHTGAPEAEAAITAAANKDPSDQVREQAVFALSQLPDERGTRALIAVAENQQLSREQRKRAVFWLGQSESSGAQAYLDKVLAGNPPR